MLPIQWALNDVN